VAPMVRVDTDGRNRAVRIELGQKAGRQDIRERTGQVARPLAELVRDPRFKGRSLGVCFRGGGCGRQGWRHPAHWRGAGRAAVPGDPGRRPHRGRAGSALFVAILAACAASGKVAIFDRTWYGRVLVERVEGFCAENDWLRAYTEINDFEHELADSGVIVVKFWLQISQKRSS
jgi:hypothetical protein